MGFNLEASAKQMPFLLRLLLLVVFITATERKLKPILNIYVGI